MIAERHLFANVFKKRQFDKMTDIYKFHKFSEFFSAESVYAEKINRFKKIKEHQNENGH